MTATNVNGATKMTFRSEYLRGGLQRRPLRAKKDARAAEGESRRRGKAGGLRPFNPARRERLWERNFGPHAEFIVQQPCVVASHSTTPRSGQERCWGRTTPAHLECRQMGGCGKGTWRRLFPACEGHHREQEGRTAEFEKRYGLRLADLVEEYILADPSVAPAEKEAANLRLAELRERKG